MALRFDPHAAEAGELSVIPIACHEPGASVPVVMFAESDIPSGAAGRVML